MVDSGVTAGHQVERLFVNAGGYIERSTSSSDGAVRIVGRVPATRLDSVIDALQARIDQLKTQVELASLTVSLDRGHVLGPLAQAGRGVFKLVSKLFVIR